MKLGFVSAILRSLSLDEVLAFAARERFACVEVMCWPSGKAERKYAGVSHIDVSGFTRTQADDVNALAQRHGIAISGLGYYPNVLDPNAETANAAIEHLREVIRAAEKLGLAQVNTFIGRDWTKSVDENWPNFLYTWEPLVAFAEEHGVRIGIENCPMLMTRDEWPGGKNLAITPAIWRRMFADIPAKNFGLNYDPSHFVLQQMNPLGPLREFRDRIFHVHAKDARIVREKFDDMGIFAPPGEWLQQRIPGFGEIDWAEFMGALMEIGYDGPVCIEVEDETFPRTVEGAQHALRVARNVLEPFF